MQVPNNITFTKTTDEREIEVDWDSVDVADHYEMEVEVNTGSWGAFASDTGVEDGDLPISYDNTDGVDWATPYRVRVRAMPAS